MQYQDVVRLRQKNSHLKSVIWEHYRVFKEDLLQIEVNNELLKNQIFEEKRKGTEIIEQYSRKVSLLEKELRNIRSFVPKDTTRKKISISDPKWKIKELEEEGEKLIKEAQDIFERTQNPREILEKYQKRHSNRQERAPIRLNTDDSSSCNFSFNSSTTQNADNRSIDHHPNPTVNPQNQQPVDQLRQDLSNSSSQNSIEKPNLNQELQENHSENETDRTHSTLQDTICLDEDIKDTNCKTDEERNEQQVKNESFHSMESTASDIQNDSLNQRMNAEENDNANQDHDIETKENEYESDHTNPQAEANNQENDDNSSNPHDECSQICDSYDDNTKTNNSASKAEKVLDSPGTDDIHTDNDKNDAPKSETLSFIDQNINDSSEESNTQKGLADARSEGIISSEEMSDYFKMTNTMNDEANNADQINNDDNPNLYHEDDKAKEQALDKVDGQNATNDEDFYEEEEEEEEEADEEEDEEEEASSIISHQEENVISNNEEEEIIVIPSSTQGMIPPITNTIDTKGNETKHQPATDQFGDNDNDSRASYISSDNPPISDSDAKPDFNIHSSNKKVDTDSLGVEESSDSALYGRFEMSDIIDVDD